MRLAERSLGRRRLGFCLRGWLGGQNPGHEALARRLAESLTAFLLRFEDADFLTKQINVSQIAHDEWRPYCTRVQTISAVGPLVIRGGSLQEHRKVGTVTGHNDKQSHRGWRVRRRDWNESLGGDRV
jgi:hypothetical protein